MYGAPYVEKGVVLTKVYLVRVFFKKLAVGTRFKANMNSDKPLQTAAIFFFLTNFYLKQGIGQVHVMVDFIYMGFHKLQGAEARLTKRKILLAHSGTRTHDLWIEKPSP